MHSAFEDNVTPAQAAVLDRVIAQDRRRESPPTTVAVQKSTKVDDRVQAVLLQVGGPVTAANLAEAVSYVFDDKVRLLENSAYYPTEDHDNLVVAFVSKNDPSKPYETASLDGMRVIVANVFADENDMIWRKVGEGDAAMLVQESQDDLDAILAQRHSYSVATATVCIPFGESYSAGDALVWYDHAREKVRYGLAVSRDRVFAFDDQTFAQPKPEQVIIAQDEGTSSEVAFEPDTVRAANADREPLSMDNMVQRHLSYMATLYSTRGEYFQRLQSLLKRHYDERMAVA